MTLLCTQTRVTTPGTTLSETAAATTATPRRRSVTRRLFFVPCSTGRRVVVTKRERENIRGKKKEKEDIVSLDGILFPARDRGRKKERTDLTKYTRKPIVIPRESELTER